MITSNWLTLLNLLDPTSKEERETQENTALREFRRDTHQAEQEAILVALANSEMPEDLRAFASRHNLGNLMELVWSRAFLAGWRGHIRSMEKEPGNAGDKG